MGNSWRQEQRLNPLVFEDLPKRWTEFAVAIHQQVVLANQKSVEVGKVLGNLFHPARVGTGGDSR